MPQISATEAQEIAAGSEYVNTLLETVYDAIKQAAELGYYETQYVDTAITEVSAAVKAKLLALGYTLSDSDPVVVSWAI